MRRTAFTLMELLIVISIIMVLMGMLFVGLRIGKEQANKAKTMAAMAELRAELDKHKQINGRYPENDVAPSTAWNDLFMTGTTPKLYNDNINWLSVNNLLIDELNAGGSQLSKPLKDGWGQALHYRPAKFYPYSPAATVAIDGEDPPNRDSYQVWSTGTGKTDQGGAKDPANDDVTSWEKK